jgi:TP901 family phage tail tape measure protein
VLRTTNRLLADFLAVYYSVHRDMEQHPEPFSGADFLPQPDEDDDEDAADEVPPTSDVVPVHPMSIAGGVVTGLRADARTRRKGAGCDHQSLQSQRGCLMAVDLGNLSIGVVPQLAALDALELRLAALDRGQYAAHIGVDTTAVAAAEQRVTSLGAAHQQLGARPVALGMDVSQVEQARTSVKNLDNDLLSLVGTSSKVAAAFAAPVAAGALTKFASDYQQILVTTSNQTTLTTADIATMDKAIRELPTGAASLQSVATAFKNVSDLGYSAADATKILSETSKAATETGADQATVALAITSAMKEYNATADEAGKYTNIVAQAAKEANSSLQAWTEGTRTGVAVAAAYGVSLQEADAFMVALTRHGFDAAEASTQLRGVIQHIVNPNAAAQQALQEVTKATGIDLVSDFSDEGLKARGFANVMADLQAVIAKTGDESIVTRLIPALRGGQGALITVTQAAGDAKVALTDLNAAADGSLKPVEDGFARISQTTGYQFSATMKQLKLDMIDLGQTFLPIADDIIQGFDKIPAGAIKAAADIGLAFAAIKTATAVGGFIDTGIASARGFLGGGADAVATREQAAASDAAATSAQAYAAALVANTEALAANTAALAGNAEAMAAEAVSAEAMLGSIEGFTLAMGVETEALAGETVALDTQTASLDANVASRKAFTAAGIAGEIALAAGLAYAMQQLDQWWVQHSPFGTGAQQPDAQYQQRLAATGQSAQYNLEEEQARLAAMQGQNAQGNINIPHVGPLLPSGLSVPSWVPGIGGKSLGGGYSDTEIAAQQDYITYLQRQAAIEASARPAGPPVPPGYSAATAGGGRGLPSAQEQKQLDADARDFAKSQADYFKQLDKDVADAKAKAQKDAVDQQKADLQAQGDYAVALATKVSDAWKVAGTAVGSVDPSKGIQGLIDAAPQLDKVRDALAAMGQSDGALSRLASLADAFRSWAADTDKANAALRGYDLTLTETTKAIQGIGSLKSEYLAALDAAEKRQAAGTADASDLAIIAARSTALNQLDQQTSRLQQQGNLDILGKLGNLPDFAQLNQNLRNVVESQGGGAAVLSSLTADKTQASADITQFQQTWHDSIEKIKSDTADAKKAVDAFLVGLPTDRTITIHYAQDAPGSVSTAQGNEGTGAYGAAGGSLGYSPLAYGQYQQIVTSGPLANNPQDYAAIIAAAQQYGVDPRALLAFINGENVAPALAAVNNFGGIKGKGGPVSTEGDTYAAYSSPRAFFEAWRANLTTGDYAGDYRPATSRRSGSGTSRGVPHRAPNSRRTSPTPSPPIGATRASTRRPPTRRADTARAASCPATAPAMSDSVRGSSRPAARSTARRGSVLPRLSMRRESISTRRRRSTANRGTCGARSLSITSCKPSSAAPTAP